MARSLSVSSPTNAATYRMGAASYRPLLYRPPPPRIVAECAEYAAWRMGLELLYRR